jgi:glycosyltransferase involved in cell wall biosynthesis
MISVCLACYNGSKYIEEQLKSILVQLSVDDEIVVSDDGSKDDTLNIIRALNDSRIKVIQGPAMAKPALNFENALKHALGDYIFLSDQDDVWLPNKVSTMMEALQANDLVVSDCRIVDANLQVISSSYYSQLTPKNGFLNNLIRNHYLGCCLAFRKRILDYALPFPKHVIMHDIWIGLCAEVYGKTGIVNEPLMLYRRHGENASPATEKSNLSISFRIEYRVRTLWQVWIRICRNMCKKKY